MLLKVEDLDVGYRDDTGNEVCAAKGVNIELDRGEILGLVGESGSGKSSVAMSVARLLPSPPAFYPKGRILFDGTDMLKLSLPELRKLRGKRIGVIFQDPIGSLSPLHSVGEQLVEAVRLHVSVTRRAARELALEWLGKTNLPRPEMTYRALPHELSGGMQQRVMIAMALINSPDLVIADEPTTALDVTVQSEILKLLKKLTAGSSGLLLITHDLGVVASMATKIAVMKQGEIIETSDEPRQFFTSPKHPYSKTLVAEAMKTSL